MQENYNIWQRLEVLHRLVGYCDAGRTGRSVDADHVRVLRRELEKRIVIELRLDALRFDDAPRPKQPPQQRRRFTQSDYGKTQADVAAFVTEWIAQHPTAVELPQMKEMSLAVRAAGIASSAQWAYYDLLGQGVIRKVGRGSGARFLIVGRGVN